MTRQEAWLQAQCDRIWQTHTRRGFVGLPFHLDRHACLNAAGCPEILAALIAYNEVIAPAAIGGLMERLERLTGEKPASQPQPHWRIAYFDDLEVMPRLGWYLSGTSKQLGKVVDLVAKDAGLGPHHKRALRLWMEGYSVREMAAETHHRRPTIEQLLDEVLGRLKGLGRQRLEVAS